MALKRSASPPMRLVSRPSQHNSGVTLFENAASLSTISGTDYAESPRRSKRVKRTVEVKVEMEELDAPVEEELEGPATPKPTRSKSKVKKPKATKLESPSPKKSKPIRMSLDVPHPPPPHWEEQYNAIKEMRKKYVAAVDTMGCDKARHKEVDPKVRSLIRQIF